MTADRIRDFFDEHYLPGNMVVAVAGDLDHEAGGGRARTNGPASAGEGRPRRGRHPTTR